MHPSTDHSWNMTVHQQKIRSAVFWQRLMSF